MFSLSCRAGWGIGLLQGRLDASGKEVMTPSQARAVCTFLQASECDKERGVERECGVSELGYVDSLSGNCDLTGPLLTLRWGFPWWEQSRFLDVVMKCKCSATHCQIRIVRCLSSQTLYAKVKFPNHVTSPGKTESSFKKGPGVIPSSGTLRVVIMVGQCLQACA